MKRLLFSRCFLMLNFFAFTFILSGCRKENQKKGVPDSVKITQIKLESYPVTDGAVPWDDPFLGSATGPDIYWKITGPEQKLSSVYIADASGGELVYTTGMPLLLNYPKSTYNLELWDKDDIDSSDLGSNDDLIISIPFSTWSSSGDEDRDAIVLSGNNYSIIIDVTYLFN